MNPLAPLWIPAEAIDALATFDGGGGLALLVDHPDLKRKIPCFAIRSPVTRFEVETIPVVFSGVFKIYDPCLPVAALYLSLYDGVPHVEVTPSIHGDRIQIAQPNPFKIECLLNPADEGDRATLLMLATQPLIRVEFFLESSALPYQGARDYPNPVYLQQEVQAMLAGTQGMVCSDEQFFQALEQFKADHPLF